MIKQIIPAIDLMEGKCVRLEKGNFLKIKVYDDDPVQYVKKLIDHGIRRIHVVDLDGARTGTLVHHKLLEKICSHAGLDVDFGGGIRERNDLRRILDAGAKYASLSSAAVLKEKELDLWISEFGADVFILCADVSGGYVRISGWMENSGFRINQFVGKYLEKGITQFLCTDISRDGMMSGPSVPLYTTILREFTGIRLIASGGVAEAVDIETLFRLGVGGVVVGKAIFEGRISLTEINEIRGRL